MANLQDLYNAILNGKLEQAVAVTQEAINEGISPTEIINQYMVKAMEEIGARFEAGKAFRKVRLCQTGKKGESVLFLCM